MFSPALTEDEQKLLQPFIERVRAADAELETVPEPQPPDRAPPWFWPIAGGVAWVGGVAVGAFEYWWAAGALFVLGVVTVLIDDRRVLRAPLKRVPLDDLKSQSRAMGLADQSAKFFLVDPILEHTVRPLRHAIAQREAYEQAAMGIGVVTVWIPIKPRVFRGNSKGVVSTVL